MKPSAPRPRRSISTRIFLWIVRAVLICLVSSVSLVIVYRWINPPVTPLMIGRWIEYKLSGDSAGIDYRWVPLSLISPDLQRAVIVTEDRKFFAHHGFDWDAIKTNWDKIQEGAGDVKGASTISMQTARNVFLWQGRSYLRKGLEAYFTYLIELFWGKERILEMYLNVIEMGTGVYGAEAAAQKHFKTHAVDLGPPEAALIAAVLPNPRQWSAGAPTKYIQRRQRSILRSM